MDRAFPLRVEVLGTLSLGSSETEEKVALTKIVSDGTRWDQNRQGWLDHQSMLTKLRYGLRKPKVFPWRNASNLSIPLVDAQIRKYKPVLMRLIVESDPVVEFVGEDADAVDAERVAESEYNWLFKTHMNAVEPMAYVIDAMAHRGYGIAQVVWDYQTEYECRVLDVPSMFPQGLPPDDQTLFAAVASAYSLPVDDPAVQRSLAPAVTAIRAGQPQVKISYKHVITDRPGLKDIDPVQMIVPPRTTNYGSADTLIVQHLIPVRQCKQMEADGFFSKGSVASILATISRNPGDSTLVVDQTPASSGLASEERLRDEMERIWGVENEDQILIWEVYHWVDHNRDGLAERVVTYLHPRSLTKLSCRPYPYPFRRWPFVKFDFEKTSRRFHSSRGISGMLESLQREINHQHNARLDAMTLRNAPIYQSPALAGFKARNFRAVPGSVIQMPLGGKIEPVVQDRGAWPEQVNEEQMLRALAENYVGTFDSAITGPRGGADRRTATEITASVQLAASTASLDTILFQLAMRDLHTMIWDLWVDLRPPEVSFKVTGIDPKTFRPDPAATEPQLLTVPKGEIDKHFKLYPTGTIANTNRALELANAKEALGAFVNDQSGFIDGYELRKWYFDLVDIRRARRILNDPQEAAELVTLRQAAAAVQADPDLVAKMQSQVGPSSDQEPYSEPTDTETYS